ncbi:MAG: glycosyltransferase family 2 protein [Bacteroidetes bacterium]|nr:glycosyltransferase family 2 protein [Bacteroidota bacterium]
MDERSPLVYCVILNLNGRTLLLETLDSVRELTYPNFRVVVADNGSTDGSLEAVRELHPDVEIVENGTNLGFGEGNNAGIRHAGGRGSEWIFLLNNDIIVDKDLLTEMMRVGVTDQTIGMLCPKIYYADEPRKLWYAGGRVNFWTGRVSHRGIRKMDSGHYDRVEETDYVTGCAMLIRSSALDAVGLFDPVYYPIYAEDADLSARFRQAGYRLVYVPSGRLWHKVSAFSGGGLTPFKTRLKVEHNLIFFRRYAKWYHWLTMPLFVAAGALAFTGRELARGNGKVVAALFGGFAGAIAKRKA